ncbi:MAG: T9SS type A sorting domain-containing protein [Bacteroidetes bacterium]|nr:T9SS type A sorting domain-containing protein [Bacteroidota bacterium]
MIRKLLLLTFSMAMVALITAGKNDGATILKSSGSHISSTGAPGEESCAKSGCHVDAKIEQDDNKVVTNLIVGNNEKTYKPATQYTVTLRATKAGIGRFGFQVVALDSNNRSIGTFAVPAGSKLVQLQKGQVNSFERTYVTHTTSGNKPIVTGQIEWRFNWTSSQKYQGKVSFYYCVNATNMNSANTGDNLFLASESFNATITNVVENESVSNDFRVYPSVASDYLTIENESGFINNTQCSVVSVGGIILQKNYIQNVNNVATIPLASLPNGFYSLVITTGEASIVKQFVVMR